MGKLYERATDLMVCMDKLLDMVEAEDDRLEITVDRVKTETYGAPMRLKAVLTIHQTD